MPPYTFIATVNVVLRQYALPVFVDTDRETFQMDARKLEAAITPRTRGDHPGAPRAAAPATWTRSWPSPRKHKVPVLEDACQAHLAEWRGRKVGTYGQAGCFSFQASKNLNSGEGGAISATTRTARALLRLPQQRHRAARTGLRTSPTPRPARNLRMTEFQAALLLAQMTRIEQQAQGAHRRMPQYLTSHAEGDSGHRAGAHVRRLHAQRVSPYMFRYDQERFGGLPARGFLKALAAEGIPASGGYTPLNTQPFLKNTLHRADTSGCSRRRRWPRGTERNRCPANDRLCEEAVWFTQTMLLGPRARWTGSPVRSGRSRKQLREAGNTRQR